MAAPKPQKVPIPRNGVDYRGKVVLAPMVRSGELPSRLVALRYGADLVWGPETIDRAMIGAQCRRNEKADTLEFTRVPSNQRAHCDPKESIIYRIHLSREKSKLIYQIGTASPDLAVQAAHVVAPHVAGIDVNAGCPKPFSTSGGMGAALLSTPDLLCSILRKLVAEIGAKYEIGISVKIRLLPNAEDTRTLVERLCQTGITGLTIHCRTRAMRKQEKAIREQLQMVGDVCRDAGVACLMNGDVENRAHAEELIKQYNVDGAMIAEAAEKNLTVFRAKADGGPAPWKEVMHAYMEEALAIENKWVNTKFLLAQMIPGQVQKTCGLSQAKNYAHVCKMLDFDEATQARAAALDDQLQISGRLTKSEEKAKKKARRPSEATNDGGNQRKRQKMMTDENGQHESSVTIGLQENVAPSVSLHA